MTVENIDAALVLATLATFLLWCWCMYRKHSRKLNYEEFKARMIQLNIGTGKEDSK